MTVEAASDKSFYRLIRRYLAFYRDELLNPHWDSSFQVHHNNTLAVSMLSQGLDPLPAGVEWDQLLE